MRIKIVKKKKYWPANENGNERKKKLNSCTGKQKEEEKNAFTANKENVYGFHGNRHSRRATQTHLKYFTFNI